MGSTLRGPDSAGPGAERSRYRWWILAAGSVVLLGTGAIWYTWSRISPSQQSDLQRAGYVDSSACSECHANIAKTYRLAGMARTFHRPSEQTVIEDFKRANRFVHQATGLTYTMIDRDGKFYMRRSEIGLDGKEAFKGISARREQVSKTYGLPLDPKR